MCADGESDLFLLSQDIDVAMRKYVPSSSSPAASSKPAKSDSTPNTMLAEEKFAPERFSTDTTLKINGKAVLKGDKSVNAMMLQSV